MTTTATRPALFELLIRLGEADPDVPHILRIHYGFVEELRRDAAAYRERPWLGEVVAGKLFGGASSELGNRVGVYTYDTTLLPDGETFRLNGRKFYSTGSPYSDYLRVTANDADGGQISALIPADRAGVVHADDWDGIGRRHTGTGTTILDNVLVTPSELLPFQRLGAERRPGGAQPPLLLHALAAGILRAVTADATALLRDRPRSYSWGNAGQSHEDPQLLQIAGELSAATFVVESSVLAAAEVLGRAIDHARRRLLLITAGTDHCRDRHSRRGRIHQRTDLTVPATVVTAARATVELAVPVAADRQNLRESSR